MAAGVELLESSRRDGASWVFWLRGLLTCWGDMVCPRGLSLEPCDIAEDLWLGFKPGGWGGEKPLSFAVQMTPRDKQDEFQHVVVFLSGSIIFGFQQPSFVLKCPALGSISEERS